MHLIEPMSYVKSNLICIEGIIYIKRLISRLYLFCDLRRVHFNKENASWSQRQPFL